MNIDNLPIASTLDGTEVLPIVQGEDTKQVAVEKITEGISADLETKLDKTNPAATGTFSVGLNATASGNNSFASGQTTTASGVASHTEGCNTTASALNAHAEGLGTVANHRSQHVFGEWNTPDDSSADANARGNYIEIVGNGNSSGSQSSNARTLDWSGNETLAGDLVFNGSTSLTNTLADKADATTVIPNVKTETSLFVGNESGDNNTESGGDSGKYNTALGVDSMRDNTTGDHNTAVGFQAMQYNTTGIGNTAFGEDALYSNKTGNGNTAVGVHALQNATGASNVAVGQSALIDQTSGFFNTAIGNEAGKGSGVPITTDHGLTLIGNRTGKNPSTEVENSTAIGYYARVDKSNQIVLGNTSVTELVVGDKIFEFNSDHTVTWRDRT